MNKTPTLRSEENSKNFSVDHGESEYVYFMYSQEIITLYINDESDRKLRETIIHKRIKGNSFWVKVKDLKQSFYAGTDIESTMFFGRELRELFKKVNGYNENVIFFEDPPLPQKIKKLIK